MDTSFGIYLPLPKVRTHSKGLSLRHSNILTRKTSLVSVAFRVSFAMGIFVATPTSNSAGYQRGIILRHHPQSSIKEFDCRYWSRALGPFLNDELALKPLSWYPRNTNFNSSDWIYGVSSAKETEILVFTTNAMWVLFYKSKATRCMCEKLEFGPNGAYQC